MANGYRLIQLIPTGLEPSLPEFLDSSHSIKKSPGFVQPGLGPVCWDLGLECGKPVHGANLGFGTRTTPIFCFKGDCTNVPYLSGKILVVDMTTRLTKVIHQSHPKVPLRLATKVIPQGSPGHLLPRFPWLRSLWPGPWTWPSSRSVGAPKSRASG